MNKLTMKARPGVTLVELLVVILIITILSVGLLPLLKPFIEQSKYAAEVQPTLANIQTKINLYQYEKDKLPCTIETVIKAEDGKTTRQETNQDEISYTWIIDEAVTGVNRAYKKAWFTNTGSGATTTTDTQPDSTAKHLSSWVDVDWQDLTGRRVNPAQFQYHVIKGSGAAKYGYALGVFGDGDGLAKGTGYAILVMVDTDAKLKLIATWERYKPVNDTPVTFKTSATWTPTKEDQFCYIPAYSNFSPQEGETQMDYTTLLSNLKESGWSFNFDDAAAPDKKP